MRSTILSSLALLTSTRVLAQNVTTEGPFYLKVVSPSNATLDGLYLAACHAGAALEGLCPGGKEKPNGASSEFYHNITTYEGSTAPPTGLLIWNLHALGVNDTQIVVPQAMTLQFPINSNVASPLFGFGYGTSVGFNNTELYLDAYYDDTKSQWGQYPIGETLQLQHWYVCYAMTGGYFYESVNWVTFGKPSNPTCQPVGIIKA